MKKITLSLCLFVATITGAVAQVKIGNNPNTIDPNSLLEMESTNKGFLPPRVVLSNETLVAPLTGTVPEGMLVYSDGGTLANGYYYWSGVKWTGLSTSGAVRTNHVLVKSEADLPAPSGGVITLVSGTYYEISGIITIANKINLNGCTMEGWNASHDQLIYTGSAELFTGNKGGTLTSLLITAASGKVFNLDAAGAATDLLMSDCYIIASNAVGTVKGIAGTVYFRSVGYQYNTSGLIFENITSIINSNSLWDVNNYGTYEKYVGTFNIIQLFGGIRGTASSNGAVALDVSGITSVTAANLKTVMFTGNGTTVVGNFSNSWEVEAGGLATQKDEAAGANLYISSPTLTAIATQDVPVKVAGTTTAATSFRVTMPTSNKLTYIGAKTRRFQVVCSITATASSNNKNFSFHIYKNGVKLPESTQSMKLATGVNTGSLTISCNVLMAPNDYVEVWVENNSDNSDITVENLNLSIK
ncbi:MAG: hypothetical protein K0S33_2760 [Bacteroidetes bacterium]|jgi:hypothetical protein|nr:hypothetical protein [Bacteroidota bacterium]